MKLLRLIPFLVLILLIAFSDIWAEQRPVEIKEVLNLFTGDPATWPIQHEDRWCWAASAEIIMSSHGRTSWKQCIQADDAYPGRSWPRTCCDLPGSPLCNRTGWPHFEYYGFDYSARTEPLEWKELTDQIDKRQPLAVAVEYLDPDNPHISQGGHMAVIAGYTVTPDGEQKILIVDPDGFHSGMWALFDEVFGNASSVSRHWRTYYDIRPLP
ncbi:MAG: C39 family peptidase [Nitrospirota bacterium]